VRCVVGTADANSITQGRKPCASVARLGFGIAEGQSSLKASWARDGNKKGHYISVKFKKKEIAVPLPGSDSIFNVPKLGLWLGRITIISVFDIRCSVFDI
jgi:hypothetical protein